ncbi:MAG: site-2 protease family protein, partial [Elusimicrobiota bacterium]
MGTRASAAAVKSAIAILLSLTLVAMSPGLFGYRALASVVAGASVGRGAVAGSGAAGAAVHGGLGSSSRLHSTLNLNLKIGSVIPSAQTLNVTKSISASLLPLRDAKVAEAAAVYNAYSTLSPIPQPVKYSAGVPHTAPGAASTGLSGVVADLMKRFAPVQLGRPGMKAAALRSGEFFDGARARRGGVSAIPAAKDMGASRHNGGLQSKAGLQAETAAQNVIPAPAEPMPAAQTKPSLWRSPYVRYGVPAAVIGATAIFFQANLLPIAVISGTLLFSILAHESAHVLGLRIWGDPTPKAAGRDFINPLMHIDPLGTLLVPAASLALSMAAIGFPLLFGWAKPIPVDFNNLKDVQHDAAKVAALGPLTNFALAGLSFAAYLALPALGLAAAGTAAFILLTVAKINLAMGLFNILPLPWLDGGKLLVSLFPKSLYARWTANPNLPGGYQSIFRRIYEGPANILSRMHVHNLDQVNGLTRAAMFATLGAFYALFFSTLSIPFLFLALPCGYDYWCIAEKVRSEQAVGEMMDLMSEWGSIIVQIAEDHDVESEVSARDVELNLVHAVDSFLEHLMTKEDFRSLSDAEKVKRFMAEFTEFAAKDLQNKAFTQDTVETIKKVLNDPRNQPFKDRLEKWLTEHEIFKKIHSPEAKKKYKDSAEAAKKERERGAGGGRMSGFIPLLGLSVAAMPFFLAGPAELLLAWVAGLGIGAIALMRGNLETSSGGGSHVPQHKIKSEVVENMRASTFWIHFTYGANEQQVVQALERLGLPHDSLTQVRMPTPDHVTYYKAEINAADSADAAAKAARALLQESLIESISMHPAAHGAFLDSQTVSMARMQPQAGLEATQLVVAINHSMSDAERNLFPLDHSLGAAASAVWTSATEMRVTAADAAQAAIFAARLGRDHRVSRIGLHRDTKAAVGIANTQSDEEAFNAEQEAADIESALPLTQAQLGKVARGTNSSLVSSHGRENLYWAYVTIAQSEYTAKTTIKKPGIREPSDVVEGRFYDLNEQGENYNIRRFRVLASHVEELVKDLVELAKDENVTRIVAHPALADALEVPADNSDPLIKTQAHDSVEGAKTMRIIFNSGTERADAVKFFEQQVLTRAERYRWEQEALIVHVRAAEDAAAISAAAAANDKVSAVRMSGEGMAALAALKES